MNAHEYVDHSVATRRDWVKARQIHRKKLMEIVRTPSKKAYTPLPRFFSDSNNRRRSQRNF
jgi:hypothetical protein